MLSWTDPRGFRARMRERLVAGLLAPDCAECPAGAGEWCDPLHSPPAELVRVDRDPPHVVHSSRVTVAAEAGHVRRDLLIAQFAGGPLPSGLTRRRTARTER